MTVGWKEGKRPFQAFDPKFYQKHFRPGENENPLMHYVEKHQWMNPPTSADQIKKPVPLKNPRYKVAICAVFRNDARFLKEWIDYHLMMGVEHFYLCNHLSLDNYADVLKPYIKKGLVTLSHSIQDPKGHWDAWMSIQNGHCRRVINNTADKVDWLLPIDTDEFLVPRTDTTIPKLLDKYPHAAIVAFRWVCFGTNGVQKLPKDGLLLEKMTKRSPGVSSVKKLAVRPRLVSTLVHTHIAYPKPGYIQVNENGIPLMFDYKPDTEKTATNATFHHYFLRDQTFVDEKARRYQSMSGSRTVKIAHLPNDDQCTETDTAAHRFVARLRAFQAKNKQAR